MGCVENITLDQFPKQRDWVGRRVTVCFHYDTSKTIGGEIVRDDMESPNGDDSSGITIIRLDDGRHVLATECQYSLE